MNADDWGTLGRPSDSNLAELLHVVETDAATLRHALYERSAFVPEGAHQLPSLSYVVGGPCIQPSNDCREVKRRLTFHPAGRHHSLYYLAKTHVLAIELSDPDAIWPSAAQPLIASLYDDVWRLMLQVSEGGTTGAITRAIDELLTGTRNFLDLRVPAWLLSLLDKLHENWSDVPSASELASAYGVSPQHLCRTFRRCTGVTLRQYGLLLRLDFARGLLWGTNMPISEIAFETGFADQSHLTRLLSAHSQRTPLRLRCTAPCLRMHSKVNWRTKYVYHGGMTIPDAALGD